MRECADFYDIRGDIAFLNGIFAAYVEEVLYEALKPDQMISLVSDVYYLGDDNSDPFPFDLTEQEMEDEVLYFLEEKPCPEI